MTVWNIVVVAATVVLVIGPMRFDGNHVSASPVDLEPGDSPQDGQVPAGSTADAPKKPSNAAKSQPSAEDAIPSYVRIVPAVVMTICFLVICALIYIYEGKKAALKDKRDIEPLHNHSIGSAWLTQIKTVQEQAKREKRPRTASGQKQLERKFQLYDDMLNKYKESIKEKPATSTYKAIRNKDQPAVSAKGTRLKELAMKHRAMSLSSSADEGNGPKPSHWFQSIDSSGSEKAKTDEAAARSDYTSEAIIIMVPPPPQKVDKDNATYDGHDERAPLMPTTSTDDTPTSTDMQAADEFAREATNNNDDDGAEELVILVTGAAPAGSKRRPKQKRPLSWKVGLPLPSKKKRGQRPKSMMSPHQTDVMSPTEMELMRIEEGRPIESGAAPKTAGRHRSARPKSLDVGSYLSTKSKRSLFRTKSGFLKTFSEEDSDVEVEALRRENLLHKSNAEIDHVISNVEQSMIMNVTSNPNLVEEEVGALEQLLDDVSRFCDDYCSDRGSWKQQTSFSEAETQLSERGTPSVSSSMFMSAMEEEDFSPGSSPVHRYSMYEFDDFQNSHV